MKTTLISILSICLSALLVSVVQAVRIMEFEAVLNLDSSEDRAIRPIAVSHDPATGEICVTDAQYARFHVINKHGVEVFTTGGFSRLSSPLDASLTSRGDFIFIGRNENSVSTIRRLTFMGDPAEFDAEIPVEDWEPRHLAITRDGNILVADSYNNILTKHDADTGALLWLAEVTGVKTDLQLGRPVEAPDGRIYLPSGIQHNVMIFSEDGKYLGAFGEFGTGPGKLVFPVGVAIGAEGSILVLDRMRHKILMYDPEYVLLGDFGSMGAAPGQFYHPTAIAASEDGTVYVAQGYESRVQVFSIRDTKAE